MDGHERGMFRDNIRAMVNRKNGDNSDSRVTRGGAEIFHLLQHQLSSLQEIQIPAIQNPDGTFALMRGWDAPQES